uniref:NADH dehydrogenase subunit 2 n=1 Tax=Bulinus globosus TaxID=157967 RepID=UPI001EE0C1D2|nr:NADH dehydrogenase subunit 2 [Bulinus globosus]QYJ56679.1 NADH dehydrogenase subunit 2 [Bulinus globosus]
MNSSSILFLLLIVLSPIISLSSSDWLIAWAGMEIGMIGVFPLLLNNTSSSKEATMKYFMIQSLASSIILIGGMLFFSFLLYKSLFVFCLGLSLKIGFFPGQFWIPSLMNSLTWKSNFLVLGPLKIAPLGLLSLTMVNSNMVNLILFLGVMSAVMGSIMGLNQTKVRGMLGSSSIAHTGWAMVSMVYGFLWGYFLSYMVILLFTLYSLYNLDSFVSSMNLLSMSGLPPFLMFVAKFKVVYFLILSSKFFLLFFLILSSVISLTFYLKFSYNKLFLTTKMSLVSIIILITLNSLGVYFII